MLFSSQKQLQSTDFVLGYISLVSELVIKFPK